MSDPIQITIPSGPYPKCGLDGCLGELLPVVHPSACVAEDGTRCWMRGTLVMEWRCGCCGRRVVAH
jgi:hypothetical protein